MVKKNSHADGNVVWWYALGVVVVAIIFVVAYFVMFADCPIGKVCMSKGEYAAVVTNKTPTEAQVRVIVEHQHPPSTSDTTTSVASRDYRVLNDPLYPPLNRSDTRTHDTLTHSVRNRNMYVPTGGGDIGDTYRLVGYLVNNDSEKDSGGNSWKLFARQKDKNTSDFYMMPSNNNFDIKIPIRDEIVVGTRLRDVYTIPSEIQFTSPMLNATTYHFIENPKTDLSTYSYM